MRSGMDASDLPEQDMAAEVILQSDLHSVAGYCSVV